jgi:hypothetical protein
MRKYLFCYFDFLFQFLCVWINAQVKITSKDLTSNKIKSVKFRNVIFILSDDHRYDFMGFTGRLPWLKTPNMYRLYKEGAWFKNAFVTTSLCSLSRASILTGAFSHVHTIVDNASPEPPGKSFIPVLKGDSMQWRDKIFYEYYWEYDFPMTLTMFGVRFDKFKYIRYYGIWDTNEL